MGVDHKLLKTSENFKGLDLRSSDVMRSQEYSTDMRNAEYRISGAINKRKGFTNKRNANFIKGMTTFKNISSNGAVTDELIYVENTDVKKEVSFDMVAYRNNNVTTPPISLTFQKTDSDITVTSVDSSVGTEYYNKTFTSSDTISDFTSDFKWNTTLPSGSGTPIVDWEALGIDNIYIYHDYYHYFTHRYQGITNALKIPVPIEYLDHSLLQNYISNPLLNNDVNPFNPSVSNFNNSLLRIFGHNMLANMTASIYYGTWQNTSTSTDPYRLTSASNISSTFDPAVHTHIVFKLYFFDDNLIDSSVMSDLPNSYALGSGSLAREAFYQQFPQSCRTKDNLYWVGTLAYNNIPRYSVSTSADLEKYFSLKDAIDHWNNTYPADQITEPFISSPTLSNIDIEIRNKSNEVTTQFLSESVMSLNTNITEISNNASSTFPTTVTTGSIEQSVGTLGWTSDDYEDILTENVNFASLNNLLYISNGIDPLLKYDGESVYRAGLPNCSKDIATFSFNTITSPNTNYLHKIQPGQVEFFTFNDTTYSPVLDPSTGESIVSENLTADYKYLFQFDADGFYRKEAPVGSSYPSSFGSLKAYNTYLLTTAQGATVVSGTGLQIEVITDGNGGIKNYYTVEKGTSYLGEDANGNYTNHIRITKAMFTDNTGAVPSDKALIYGDLEIVDVSSAVRDRTYEYRFAYEYTDYKGNIISSQPSDPVKLVVGSGRSVNLTFPLTISDLSTFKTNGVFDTAWQEANGVTLGTTLTDTNYPIEKLSGENRLRILVYRSKGYSPIAGEVVGQYYKIADLEYVAGGTEDPNNPGTFLPTTFTDTYHDEPNDAEAATQYDPVINPFLAFVEPIKRKDPPPKGKYLTIFKNCLVIAGQNDNVNNVQYSLPKNFTTGEIGSEYFPDDDNGIVVESPFGSKITAVAALRDALFVFHKDSIFSVTGNINQLELPSVNLITKEGGVGCTSQASIEEFKGGLAFVSHTGVFSISNQGLSEISEIIKPLFLQDKFIKEKAITYNWTDRNLLLICIPDYIVQGDQEYSIINDTMDAYISKDSLILAFDYYRGAWLRWDTIEFTNGITEVDGVLNFAQLTNTTNTLATVNNQGDTDDYSDNGNPINFVYETNWESLGDPTTPKKFLRIKVHSFDTDGVFESPGFLLEAGIQKNYQNYNEGKITFDFGAITGGGWGNFAWGSDSWGSIPAQYLKSKLPTGKARSFKIRFANNENNENVLITNYELEIAAPYRPEIKE